MDLKIEKFFQNSISQNLLYNFFRQLIEFGRQIRTSITSKPNIQISIKWPKGNRT